MPQAVQDYNVNVGNFELLNMRVVETLPPNSPFASLMGKPGVQSTPSLSRGNLNNSAIALLNGNLEHACDFKFMFTLNFSTLGLINPVEAIQKALKNAKLKATNRMRSLLKDAAQLFRKAIDAVLKVLSYDPSGQLSLYFQLGKDVIRKVNEAIEFVAEKVEEVMEWIFFAQQIIQLTNWIMSLPDKLKKLLATCLSNFTNSLKQVANTISSIPDQIANMTQAEITKIANQFAESAQLVASAAEGALNTTNDSMPDAVYLALTDAGNTSAIETQIASDSATTTSVTDTVSQLTTSTTARP